MTSLSLSAGRTAVTVSIFIEKSIHVGLQRVRSSFDSFVVCYSDYVMFVKQLITVNVLKF